MQVTKFTIENFERFKGEIMAETEDGQQHIINEMYFERFLRQSEKMDFCHDVVFAGDHQQVKGTCTIEEYWDFQGNYHLVDIAEYLAAKYELKNSLA